MEIEDVVLKFKDYNYKDFKIEVANKVCDFIKDVQDKFYEYRKDEYYLKEVLKKGAINARIKASKKLNEVRKVVGIKI